MRASAALLILLLSCAPSGPGRAAFRTPGIAIEGVESPLNGPRAVCTQTLAPHQPRLVWLTGLTFEGATDGEGRALSPSALGQLRADLDLSTEPSRAAQAQATGRPAQPTLFSLGEGVSRASLPPGFGIPLMSNEAIKLTTTLVNLDPYQPATRAEASGALDFVYQHGLSRPMVPVWVRPVRALVSREGRPLSFGVERPSAIEHGEGCAVLPPATDQVISDELGRSFAAEWLLPEGLCQTRTLVTQQLQLPDDTTLHYATAELLPHARRIELRDRTGQRALVTLEVSQRHPFGTLAQVPVFSSAQGVPMLANHQYELLATYEGPAGAPASATMWLYLRDKKLNVSELED